MTFEHIIFDLDGTLTDSGLGIRNAVRYTLRKYGIEENDTARLNRFIGPPLPESFRAFYGIDEPDDLVLESTFREYYSDKGIFENELYDGICECAETLLHEGRKLYIATSKPQFMAESVASHFEISKYFTRICGAERDLKLVEKADVLRKLFSECPELQKEKALMVGDRKFDVIGANAHGIPTVGVLWGYGSEEELTSFGAAAVVKTPRELCRYILDET